MSRNRHDFRPSLVHPMGSDKRIPVPSLADVGVPSSMLPDLPETGRLRLGDVDVGAGRPAASRGLRPEAGPGPAPALWLTDHDIRDPADTWRRLADRFAETGLWPLLLTPLSGDDDDRPWGGKSASEPFSQGSASPR
jgi:hypothetical protein